MHILTIFINTVILLIATVSFSELIRRFQKQRPMPPKIPLPRQGEHSRMLQSTLEAPHRMPSAARSLILDNMNDGMIVLDNQNCIVDINLAARRIIQQSMVGLIGQALDEALPPLARQLQMAESQSLDIALGQKGDERFYEVSVSPFHGSREQRPGRLLVMRDVTERKKREDRRENVTRTIVYDLRDSISNSLFALEMMKTSLAETSSPDAQELLALTLGNTVRVLQLVDKILETDR